MTHRLIDFLKLQKRLLISELESEAAIRASAVQGRIEVKGRDCDTGLPRSLNLEAEEIRYATEEPEGPED